MRYQQDAFRVNALGKQMNSTLHDTCGLAGSGTAGDGSWSGTMHDGSLLYLVGHRQLSHWCYVFTGDNTTDHALFAPRSPNVFRDLGTGTTIGKYFGGRKFEHLPTVR